MTQITSPNGERACFPSINTTSSGDEPTCLSSENHQISDYLSHFLGCIEIGRRKHFFNKDGCLWRDELERQKRVLPFQSDDKTYEKKVDEKLCRSIDTCIDELVRIKKLRKALKVSPKHGDLIRRIEESRQVWRTSAQGDIIEVGKWSQRKQRLEDFEIEKVIEDLKADAKTYLPAPNRSYTDKIKQLEEQDYDPENDLKAYIIQWDQDDHGTLQPSKVKLKSNFPDQRVPLNALLEVSSQKQSQVVDAPDAVSLAAAESSGKLRYFHFPANNMQVWLVWICSQLEYKLTFSSGSR